ncbi:MAG: adenylate/guanylate cyclase domain-containing protein, partial [Anaerolineales bacterium]
MGSILDDFKNLDLINFLPPHLRKKILEGREEIDHQEVYSHLVNLRKSVTAYLPEYLSNLVAEQDAPGDCSILARSGSLVFADVSGFTAMSEKLSALGKEGAEEITLIVNNYFERMIGISLQFGGDLIKFGGDALILFFEGHDAGLRGLQSAASMQAAMHEFEEVQTSQGVSSLKMSIGIASGLVYMMAMGTDEKMDYLATGSTLERLDVAESISQAGQIVIDANTYRQVQEKGIFAEVEPGFWMLNQVDEGWASTKVGERGEGSVSEQHGDYHAGIRNELAFLQRLKPYIPIELFDHLVLHRRGDVYQGAHRPVTVLFVHFYGMDMLVEKFGTEQPEVVLEVMNTYYRSMTQVIKQFGGTISRVDSYKSGNRLLVLFGALRAHEDDHQRAVRTAWEMNKSLAEMNQSFQQGDHQLSGFEVVLGQRIGINSGFVFASDVGASFRREYTVMGDQVNLTARLMSAAEPGEILIGEATSSRLGRNIILEDKNPIMVKGKAKQVRLFALMDIQQEDAASFEAATPVFGRETELSQAKDYLEDAIHGQFRSLVIRGDSGIGKTRLAQEIISFARERNVTVLSSYSQSFNRSMPYSPWNKIYNQIFGLDSSEEMDEPAIVAQINHSLRDIDAEVWAPLFGSIMGLDIPESQLTRSLEGKVRQQKIFDLTLQLLSYQAKKNPLVLFLDDIQWADPVSLELILHVINNMPPAPLLLMVAHRMDEGMPDWSEYGDLLDIPLAELPDYASIQIVQQMVGGITLPNQVINFIIEKTSGNPLFIFELMYALQDEGIFAVDQQGSWQVGKTLDDIEVPDTIHGMVISRVDRLPLESRYILQLASVVGVDFSLPFLEEAFDLDQGELEIKTRLDHLAEMGVIEILGDSTRFKFQHLTTRDVVYSTLPYQERRKYHILCGGYIESHPDAASGEQIDLMAFHFYEGQSWDKAVDYNLRAGDRAKTIYANQSAIGAYQRVVESISASANKTKFQTEMCSAMESLGDVFTLVGQYEQALEKFTYALENLCGRDDRKPELRTAEFNRKIANIFERQSEYDIAFEWLEKGLQQLEQDDATIEAARIYLLGTGIYRRLGQNDEAELWCQKSLEIASQIESREGQQAVGQAYYNLGGIENRRGDLQRSVEYHRQSLEVYQEIEDVIGQARAYTNLGVTYSDLGEWEQAVEAYNKSLEINQQIGDIQREGFLANNLANVHLYRGEWDQAAQLFKQSNGIWKRIGSPFPDAVTLSNLAQVHIYQGNWDQARESLTRSQEIFTEIGSEDFLSELERRWAEL